MRLDEILVVALAIIGYSILALLFVLYGNYSSAIFFSIINLIITLAFAYDIVKGDKK